MNGSTLKKIRKSLGLTQAGFAKRLRVTPNTVARWERDEVPIRETMAQLIRLIAQTVPKPSGEA